MESHWRYPSLQMVAVLVEDIDPGIQDQNDERDSTHADPWIDKSLQSMRRAPRMWGSWEAVELQNILLWEMKALALNPAFISRAPRPGAQALSKLHRWNPSTRNDPLFSPHPQGRRVSRVGLKACRAFTASRKRNFRLHGWVALPDGRVGVPLHAKDPKATVNARDITSYYEEFVRAARGPSRGRSLSLGMGLATAAGGRTWRHRKELEEATRFTLEDVQIERPNGVPGGVAHAGPPDRGRRPPRRAAGARRAGERGAMAEWASSDDPVPPTSYMGQPHVALQTLRLLPPKHLAQVELGPASLVRAPTPSRCAPAFEPKLVQVVEAHTRPTPFDGTDEIRAVDLTRASISWARTRARYRCYLTPKLLREVNEVGVKARVEGSLYRPLAGVACPSCGPQA